MKKNCGSFFKSENRKKILFFAIMVLAGIKIWAQPCDPPTTPNLFGQSVTAVYCKNSAIGFGVNDSDPTQNYYFSVYNNVVITTPRGGPLDGNGSQLSVSAFMQSARGCWRIQDNDH